MNCLQLSSEITLWPRILVSRTMLVPSNIRLWRWEFQLITLSSTTAQWTDTRIHCTHMPNVNSTVTAASPAPLTSSSVMLLQSSKTANSWSASHWKTSSALWPLKAGKWGGSHQLLSSKAALSQLTLTYSLKGNNSSHISAVHGRNTQEQSSWSHLSTISSSPKDGCLGSELSDSRLVGTQNSTTTVLVLARIFVWSGMESRPSTVNMPWISHQEGS